MPDLFAIPGAPDRPSSGGSSSAGTTGEGQSRSAAPEPAAEISLDVELASSVEWLVPAAALAIPGLLILLSVVAQVLGGVIWIPLARRFVGRGDEHEAPRA